MASLFNELSKRLSIDVWQRCRYGDVLAVEVYFTAQLCLAASALVDAHLPAEKAKAS